MWIFYSKFSSYKCWKAWPEKSVMLLQPCRLLSSPIILCNFSTTMGRALSFRFGSLLLLSGTLSFFFFSIRVLGMPQEKKEPPKLEKKAHKNSSILQFLPHFHSLKITMIILFYLSTYNYVIKIIKKKL